MPEPIQPQGALTPYHRGTGAQAGRWRKQPLACWALSSALLLGLVACGAATTADTSTAGTSSAVTDPIVFQTSAMPAAYIGEAFNSNVAVLGGVGPYSYRIVAGNLPPGVSISGSNLSGTPTQTGPYNFTVEVTDANLSTKVNAYTLNVNELLPLTIEPELPSGQIRGETRVPLKINAARSVRAASVTWDLGKNIKVTNVQATDSSNVVIWKQQGSVLTLALGFKTVPRSGTRVALVSVKPGQVVSLSSSNFWFDSRDGTGKVLGDKKPLTAPTALPSTLSPTLAVPVGPTGQPTPTVNPLPTTYPAAPSSSHPPGTPDLSNPVNTTPMNTPINTVPTPASPTNPAPTSPNNTASPALLPVAPTTPGSD